MRVLKHRLIVFAPIQSVFGWFINLDKNYIKWHPVAHEQFKWLSGKPIGKGSLFYLKENIDGHHHEFFMEVTEYMENDIISFSSHKMKYSSKYFPNWMVSLLSSVLRVKIEMSRYFESRSQMSSVIYTTHKFGSRLPVFAGIIDWYIDRFIFSSEKHLKHIEEEGMYMKKRLEEKI